MLYFCTINGLHAANTIYKQKRDNRYWKWQSPDGRTCNQIGYILVNRRGRGNLRNCRAFPSADIGSDHQLLLANFKLKLRRTNTVQARRKPDINKLRNTIQRNEYQNIIQEKWKTHRKQFSGGAHPLTDVEGEWTSMKKILQETAAETLGTRKTQKGKEWISDTTLLLADQRKKFKVQMTGTKEEKKHYNYLH